MELEFLDRANERANLLRLIRVKPSRPRVITLDSPAGMGKTRLLFRVCRDIVRDAYRRDVEWRIVWLDFRKHFPRQYSNERDVIEEIARQICRDTGWSNICDLIQEASPDDQILIQQAAFIPMEDTVREALLDMVAEVSKDTQAKINDIITRAFRDADIQEARQRGDLLSVLGLVGFILDKHLQSDHCPIPEQVLIAIDGVDAIADGSLRQWMINSLALGLGVHIGLQNTFKRFAVVVSGRFIEQDVDPQRKQRDFQEIVLRSFTDKPDYVEDLICQFGDATFETQGDLVNRLARKLCQVCGGHPRVIKETAAELYACPGHFTALDMDPEGINYWYAQDTFRNAVKEYRDTAISEILEGVGNQERCLLGLLSVFRQFTSATLEFLFRKIREEQLHRYSDCFEGDVKESFEALRKTRLIGNDEAKDPFDSDRFSLNLLYSQMREEDSHMFRLLNEWAVHLFADWVKGKFSDVPDAPLRRYPAYQQVGICEWLFHRLHLPKCCSERSEARELGQQIAEELKEILKDIEPYPSQSQADRRQRIKEHVEDDKQIDHLIWEIALEDQARHDAIRDEILKAF